MIQALFSDTIVAIATPRGVGALAVVRLSGPDSGDLLLKLAPELGDTLPEPRYQRLVKFKDPRDGTLLDQGLATYFPAPRSYTGEDSVEISTHGGALAPQLVVDALVKLGARMALPGEFTRRAFLNGKLDLLQAEAVLDLVGSGSAALHRAALHQMERGLSERITSLRKEILRTEALVAYGIDFPEEDEPPVPPARIREAARVTLDRIEGLLASAPRGEMLREGALVVLAGYPNSGKSSLFNALLGVERAIVTDVAGTTRDAIEAVTTIDGYPFRLVDTAGLRETGDRIEAMGIEVARRYLEAADVVLYCCEADRPLGAEEKEFLSDADGRPLIVVRTKADIGTGTSPATIGDEEDGREIMTSSRTGVGLDVLRDRLLSTAYGSVGSESDDIPLVTRRRHAEALRSAADEMESFLRAEAEGIPVEFAATHLRTAAHALEELIGAVVPDDVLGEIFSEFCVGK